jgi:hypothetical protein
METPPPGNREIFDEDKSADSNNGAKHSPTKEAPSSLSSETIMETPLPGNIETFDEDKSADGNNGADNSSTKEAPSSLSSETIMETPLPGNIETFDEDKSADGNNGADNSSTIEAPSSLSNTIMETPPGNREIAIASSATAPIIASSDDQNLTATAQIIATAPNQVPHDETAEKFRQFLNKIERHYYNILIDQDVLTDAIFDR